MRRHITVRGFPGESSETGLPAMIERGVALLSEENGIPMRVVRSAPFVFRGDPHVSLLCEPLPLKEE